jgi:predicted transcriptional regulator
MLSLACITIDTWSVTSASFIATMLKYPNLPQKDIGKKMRITQSSVSERRKRSRYDEIMDMEAFYRYMLTQTMKIP